MATATVYSFDIQLSDVDRGVYEALSLRAERAQRDPTRDQARMLELKPFADALANADPADAEAQALRWELQELRVQLFAQELGVKGGVSPKRLAARLERLKKSQ